MSNVYQSTCALTAVLRVCVAALGVGQPWSEWGSPGVSEAALG